MDRELFNPKTIERLCSKIKLTQLQKKSSREWLYFLEEGKLKKEKLNYPKFMIIVLQNLLGYDIKGMAHEEGYIEFSFKNKEGKTILGIEAKGTDTKDLFAEQSGYREGQKTPIDQLWNYMGKLDLDYGVATNYKDFVLLDRSKGSSSYHYFNFEEVNNNEQKLKEFIAIFSKEQIIDNGFIEKLKEESSIEERNFTKEFYKLFHETRLMLIKEFQDNGVLKEESIHFAQLFLNRLMFVFFAEDTDKLDKRLFEDMILSGLKSEIISDQSKVISDTILSLFLRLDKGSLTPRKIFGFNGGLFEESIPPRIYFKDLRDGKFFKDILQYSKLKKEPELNGTSKSLFDKYQNKLNHIIKNLLIMASFDFKTEVSVNILGHIFEQSLTDLEDLKEGKSKKRKKEGIFYTPEHITNYICRNTIIQYLSKKNSKTARELVLEHSRNIKELNDKLTNLRILDPACGSGAFLIKAIDVLLEIHKELQLFKQFKGEYTAIKKGRKFKKDEGQLTLVKWHEEDEAREIIEDNIFGVDINDESVEITKLSLFLKIARKNKKLLDLSKNIKCGNSLIDDKEVNSRAFIWEKEFPFKFDIVIGNPPYVGRSSSITEKDKKYIKSKFITSEGKYELYQLFIEKCFNLIKSRDSYISLITPQTWLSLVQATKLRENILTRFNLKKIVFIGKGVFEASVDNIIFLIKSGEKTDKIKFYDSPNIIIKKIGTHPKIIQVSKIKSPNFIIPITSSDYSTNILSKIESDSIKLSDIGDWRDGVKVVGNAKKFAFQLIRFNEKFFPMLLGVDINRYYSKWSGMYCCRDKTQIIKHNALDIRLRDDSIFKKNKLLIRKTGGMMVVTLDKDNFYYEQSLFSYSLKDLKYNLKYILAILNSKLSNYILKNNPFSKKETFPQIRLHWLKDFPLKKADIKTQEPFIQKVDIILELNNNFYKKKNNFLKLVKQEYNLDKIPKKLMKFYELDFDTFIKQLGDKKLTINQKSELLDFFDKNKKIILYLKEQIRLIDEEINNLVYDLYGISDKEKEIIEKSLA